MIYYISDPHFGHSNIITLCSRPFEDVGQMNKTIISNWNSRVRADDTVYLLGDVAYKCSPEEVEAILKKLNGHKHLLVGNHDEWMNKVDAGDYFESVDNLTEINDDGRRCILCHYPMLSWNHEDKTYMIYGHIHSDAAADLWPYTSRKLMLNAGVEFNNYMPVTLDELIANNARMAEEAGEWTVFDLSDLKDCFTGVKITECSRPVGREIVIPVPALNEEFDVAILGSLGEWYDHIVVVEGPLDEDTDVEDVEDITG